jgi:large subunit ribosomal protein L22
VPGPKLNEAPVLRRRPESRSQAIKTPVTSARATAKYVRVSPYKVRQVLDLVRGFPADRAEEILRFCERDAATVVGKLLASAVANAEHDHALVGDELFVSACFADEGPTLKRWRPRARGRATRIRKRTCHVTLIVSRLPDRELQVRRARQAQGVVGDRRRRRGAAAEPAERGRPTRRRPEDRATATLGGAPATETETPPVTAEPPVDAPVTEEAVATPAEDDTSTEGDTTTEAAGEPQKETE